MERRSCWLLVIAALLSTAVAVEFVAPEGTPCGGVSQKCISIRQCAAYQTRAAILSGRPKICGFSGATPRVCCVNERVVTPTPLLSSPATGEPVTGGPSSEEPITEPPPESPVECGRPRSIFRFIRFKRDNAAQLEHSISDVPELSPIPTQPPIQAAVGGIDAIIGKWPWMALLGRWSGAELGGWFCGGTLITDRHVLTAAHCLRPEEAAAVGVRVGDNDLNRADEVEHQERRVARIVRHPQYLGSQNDLAVVRLAAPVALTEDVSPICLPPAGAEHRGQLVEMAGWGLLEFGGNASDVLQEVALRVADPARCEAAYRRVPQFEARFPGGFQGTKVCAESRDGEPRDACRGDSGGPLMVRLEESDTYQLVGVVSTGVGCGNPEFPGLYTKVSAYTDWIARQLT